METFSLFMISLLLVATVIYLLVKISDLKKRQRKKIQILNNSLGRYSRIINLEEAVKSELGKLNRLKKNGFALNQKYQKAKEVFQKLDEKIRIYQDDLELIGYGIYKPIFDFDTPEKYKARLLTIIERQKNLIKQEQAAKCDTSWQVGGSLKQGEIMIKRYIKLTIKAFNGECESLISRVKWNNMARIEERIKRAFESINQLGKSNNVYITNEFLQLKLDELHLTYEYELKKYEAKEEQRRIREQMREEEKAQKELEKARRDAEAEEQRYQKALEQAQRELLNARGEEMDKLSEKIELLQKQLDLAHEEKERAISRAQMTKSGHVYVISNIGSFGEDIYKIGMTRRLDPFDRVKELGDASVPFQFDVHAIIFSENAPELENILHKEFDSRRVNMVNLRKEYFKVSLEEIEKIIKNRTEEEIEFTQIAEAKEYRETLSLLESLSQEMNEKGMENVREFPEALF